MPPVRSLAASLLLFAGMIGVPAAVASQRTAFDSSFFGPLVHSLVSCGVVPSLTLSCCVPALWVARGTAHERTILRSVTSIGASITALVALGPRSLAVAGGAFLERRDDGEDELGRSLAVHLDGELAP